MLDAQLVSAALSSRAAYDKIAPFITAKDLTPAGGFWYGLIGEWYANDRTATRVDREVIAEGGSKKIGNPKHRETLMGFIKELPEAVSAANVAQIALELKRHNTGLELATAVAAQDQKKIPQLVKAYDALLQATELRAKRGKWQIAADAAEIFRSVGHERRIPLAPAALNSRIGGGALPGHSIGIFGRPDSGKSTFAVNLATVTAHTGQRVLYAGTEDYINVLKARSMSRMTSMTFQQMEADQEKALRLWRDRGGEERLRFAQLVDGSVKDLPEQIEEFEPTILVIDQIRSLSGEGDGMTQRLENNGIAVRNMLLQYGLIGVSVTQAGGSAEGKLWLEMTDLDGSKTGLPGTLDLQLGLGFNDDLKARNQRALAFCKNKLSSEPGSTEGIIVDVNFSLSKVT